MVSVLNLVTYINKTPIFEYWVMRCRSKNKHENTWVYGDWTMFSKFVNHSKLHTQHKCGGPMWPSYSSMLVDFDNS